MHTQDNRKIKFARVVGYTMGIFILALGLTLNTKVQLGVAAVLSVSYSASEIWRINFGNATLIFYVLLVLIEIVIHIILKRYKAILMDAAQILFSLVFTRLLNVYKAVIPDFRDELAGTFWGSIPGRMIVLLVAIVVTGIGAAMMLNARFIPNPADGIVQAFSDLTGKDTGLVKNMEDGICLSTTIIMCMATVHHLVGIGIGSVISMLGVGRVIAAYNKLLSP